jgi:probable phosphoglycerate mutase
MTRKALDGAPRRRIYLLRHAETSYVDEQGNAIPDSRSVPLTARGREQADEMARMLAPIAFDVAVCSGLPRTRETAVRVLAGRGMTVEDFPALEEIRPGHAVLESDFDLMRDVAYAGKNATRRKASLLGGEPFIDFRDRVVGGVESLLARHDWSTLLLVCHGGTNAMILAWALDAGLDAFGAIEQDNCCVNVIDVDVDREKKSVVRKYVRALNVTAYDPVKSTIELTAWETIARSLLGMG